MHVKRFGCLEKRYINAMNYYYYYYYYYYYKNEYLHEYVMQYSCMIQATYTTSVYTRSLIPMAALHVKSVTFFVASPILIVCCDCA